MKRRKTYRELLLMVGCPHCEARPWELCSSSAGRRTEPHPKRVSAYLDEWLESIGYEPLGSDADTEIDHGQDLLDAG